MKNLFLFVSLFVVINVFSQQYGLDTHPLKSDIWMAKNLDTVTEVRPKEYDRFCFDYSYVTKNIDPVKIQQYLFESYNQFRSDYGLIKVDESLTLTNSAIDHSKKLFIKYEHSTRKSMSFSEAIAIIPFTMFSRISEKDGDVNKIIADACFDFFVGCPIHMSILLNEKPNRQYGCGITVKKWSKNEREYGSISIVIQGESK